MLFHGEWTTSIHSSVNSHFLPNFLLLQTMLSEHFDSPPCVHEHDFLQIYACRRVSARWFGATHLSLYQIPWNYSPNPPCQLTRSQQCEFLWFHITNRHLVLSAFLTFANWWPWNGSNHGFNLCFPFHQWVSSHIYWPFTLPILWLAWWCCAHFSIGCLSLAYLFIDAL